jgi:hypothetical protein
MNRLSKVGISTATRAWENWTEPAASRVVEEDDGEYHPEKTGGTPQSIRTDKISKGGEGCAVISSFPPLSTREAAAAMAL